jgi:hypothetical protein
MRLSDREHEILTKYAAKVSLSASEVLRDYIKSLEPKVLEPQQ